ncbi:MAG: phosphoenolpyruvate--protein phosphotransferase [Halioglobus sp.]
MKVIQGKLVSPGFADGRAVLFRDRWTVPARETVDDAETEVARLQRALHAARKDLEGVSSRVHSEFGAQEAEIFSSHLEILNDPVLVDDIVARIRADNFGAGRAIQASMTSFAERLAIVDDPYLREREQDIRDVGRRLLRHVNGHLNLCTAELVEGTVIVAGELMPSDLVELDYAKLVGVVPERGGAPSHVAILARSLGIPAITGIHDATRLITEGQRLLIDGSENALVIAPSYNRLETYRARQREYLDFADVVARDEHLPCQTRDGREIQVLANMGRPNEAEFIASEQLAGVGLLRTEFLFLDHPRPPTVAQQMALYEEVAQRLGGRELVIRTLDLGGDKFPLFLEREFENNPGMGVRGIRFSLSATRSLFRDQIRALLLVARRYPISILLPMVVGVDDFEEAQAVMLEVAGEEGIDHLPPVGVLVETPAAVLMIDALARRADFISIGTNDLAQFILAADRNALETVDYYRAIHPSLLQAIQMVIDGTAACGKPLTICGELASMPDIAGILVGMGVTRLSMSPVSSARVKHAIRHASYAQLQQAAAAALAAPTAAEVARAVQGIMPG